MNQKSSLPQVTRSVLRALPPDRSPDEVLRSVVAIPLIKGDIVIVIDALLQSQRSLGLPDHRYHEVKSVDDPHACQLALADQLEDLMTEQQTA